MKNHESHKELFEDILHSYEYDLCEYSELYLILTYLMFLKQLHHSHHWIVSDKKFYSSHLLFQRLYEEIDDEIDKAAEKAIGVTDPRHLNASVLSEHIACIFRLIDGFNMTDIFQKSLFCEKIFLNLCREMVHSMESKGLLSRGIDNMIAGFEDVHENHVYLLKQTL